MINLAVPKAEWRSLTFYAPAVRILGLVIPLAATAFTIWARLALGTMWSGAPAVKQEHQLRTDGPYSITRHPIYAGMLGMLLGCLLVTAGGRWIVPCPVFLVLLEIKLHIEERLMRAEFRTTIRAIASGCPSSCPACSCSANARWPSAKRPDCPLPRLVARSQPPMCSR